MSVGAAEKALPLGRQPICCETNASTAVSQAEQADAPPHEYWFAGQARHAALEVPAAVEKVPAGQSVQAAAPAADQAPAGQAVQLTAPAGLKVPAAQVAHALPGVGEPMPAAHSAQLEEPSVEVAPAAQGRQVALLLAPVALLKVAAGHGCGAAPAAQ